MYTFVKIHPSVHLKHVLFIVHALYNHKFDLKDKKKKEQQSVLSFGSHGARPSSGQPPQHRRPIPHGSLSQAEFSEILYQRLPLFLLEPI